MENSKNSEDFVCQVRSILSPEKKRQKMEVPSQTPQSKPIPSLPDDLQMSCFARVSRLYYLTLSLVSKSFRSLLVSPELYKARSLLGRTQSCLYVCIQRYATDEGPTLYTLCRKPNQTLTNHNHTSKKKRRKKKKKKKSSGYVLAKVPILPSPHARNLGLVSVGSDIYSIGAGPGSSYYFHPSSSVWVLDCQSHAWHEAPSMKVELNSVSATVVDRKIYVAGSHRESAAVVDRNNKNSFQVFETRTQIWEPGYFSDPKSCFLYPRSACIDGKFRLRDGNEVFGYSSDESRWYPAEPSVCRSVDWWCCCEIGNVMYSFLDGLLSWYDTNESVWRNLKGLVGLPKLPQDSVRLADYGGKMAVLWTERLPSGDQEMIWCAEISLERRRNCEIWGEVEWFDRMLTVPTGCEFLKVLVATV